MDKCYLWELVDITDESEDAKLLIEAAGMSIVKSGPPERIEIRVKDDTEEGRELIKKLREKGFSIKSINN